MKATDKQQRTLIDLALNSLEVVNWSVMGKCTGIVVRNEFKTLKYPMDIKHWNTHLPPSFDINSKGPSPEYKIRKFIKDHFAAIRKLVTKNEWLICDDIIELDETESIVLFNLTGVGSHYVISNIPATTDKYISCNQFLDAAERKLIRNFRQRIEAEVVSNIGKINATKLFNADPEKRTMMYLRMYQKWQMA